MVFFVCFIVLCLLFIFTLITYIRTNLHIKINLHLAPNQAPANVRLEHADSRGIRVRWDPLSEESSNGQLRGYTVCIRRQNYHEEPDYDHRYEYLGRCFNTTSSETEVVLTDLDGGREYEISVAAFTAHLGPRSDWNEIIFGKDPYLQKNYFFSAITNAEEQNY